MPDTVNHESAELADTCQRYLRLYTGAIADMLDKQGYRNQVLPHYIVPRTVANRLAGPAFTGQGCPVSDPASNDMPTRLAMLECITPGTVSVWSCGGSLDCAHWGEIMSTAARQRGCTGAVLDGGVRDLDFVNAMGYPVFARFRSSATSIGRWEIKAYQVPIRIGEVLIRPGDFVFGDIDGVVIVPQELTFEVLAAAENLYAREGTMREELRRGLSIQEAYAKYGSL
jgi:4-hydroxy-4-methyl-2-oxoglutarate aldolase